MYKVETDEHVEVRMFFFLAPDPNKRKMTFQEFSERMSLTWHHIDTSLEFEDWLDNQWKNYCHAFDSNSKSVMTIEKFVSEVGKEKEEFERIKARREDGDQLIPQWEWDLTPV